MGQRSFHVVSKVRLTHVPLLLLPLLSIICTFLLLTLRRNDLLLSSKAPVPAQAHKGEQGKSSRAHKTKTSSFSSILAHSTALVHVPAHANKPASRIGSVSHGMPRPWPTPPHTIMLTIRWFTVTCRRSKMFNEITKGLGMTEKEKKQETTVPIVP